MNLPNQQEQVTMDTFLRGLWEENPVFVMLLGMCPVLAVSNSAMQAIGCIAMRACQTNNCPVGIATQKPDLRSRLVVDQGAKRLARFLESTVHLMQTLARACAHTNLQDFVIDDLTSWKKEIAELTGVRFAGSGG